MARRIFLSEVIEAAGIVSLVIAALVAGYVWLAFVVAGVGLIWEAQNLQEILIKLPEKPLKRVKLWLAVRRSVRRRQ